jgi:hypothetical protein
LQVIEAGFDPKPRQLCECEIELGWSQLEILRGLPVATDRKGALWNAEPGEGCHDPAYDRRVSQHCDTQFDVTDCIGELLALLRVRSAVV